MAVDWVVYLGLMTVETRDLKLVGMMAELMVKQLAAKLVKKTVEMMVEGKVAKMA